MLQRSQKKVVQQNTNKTDTIAAIATASAAGGIGVVRVSGAKCQDIAMHILGRCPSPRQATYLDFKHDNGDLIDRGIAIYYQAPHSYTGEDVLELQAHGGLALMQALLARCIALGAEQAAPGEFTKRAFLNDKIDLVQAEAVADLINAATYKAAQSALRSLSGEFSQSVNQLLQALINLRLYVEACLDFPEEEIDFIAQGSIAEKIGDSQAILTDIFNKAKQGALLREGARVVLVGRPNVGKSSLLNALSGDEVAIVTSVAGTTRDTIKNVIQINGVPLHIIDTAGLRKTDDEVEKMGIARTIRASESADIALLLTDVSSGVGSEQKAVLDALPQEIAKIWVHNKIDLLKEKPKQLEKNGEAHIYLSVKTGAGLDLLKQYLLAAVGYQQNSEGVFMARARHIVALNKVAAHLSQALAQIDAAELIAEELRLAQQALNSITGEFTPDDLLGEIFSQFCIGK